MSSQQDIFERLSDMFNPLLVRELRQSLRGNIFAWSVSAATVICAVSVTTGIVSTVNDDSVSGLGQIIFMVIYGLLWLMMCVVTPTSTANSFRTERSEGEFNLFMISGIPVWKVISGKQQSAIAQSFLVLAAVAPFMLTCYMLRGISIFDIAISLLILILASVLLNQLAILLGALNIPKILYSLIGGIFTFGLVAATILSMNFIVMTSSVSRPSHIAPGVTGSGLLLFVIMFSVIFTILLFLASVAALELRNKNKLLPIKVFILICVAVLPALGLLPYFSGSHDDVRVIFCMFTFPILGTAILFLPMGYAEAPAAVREKWKKILAKASPAGWLLYPGKGSFYMWLSVCMFLFFLWEFIFMKGTTKSFEMFGFITLSGLSVWCFLGNLFRFFMPKLHPLILSLIPCALASLAALQMSVFSNNSYASLLFPLGLAFHAEKSLSYDLFVYLSLSWWVFIFLYGYILYSYQLMKESAGEAK